MIVRIEAYFRKLSRFFSRVEWTARLLGLPRIQGHATKPGLILIQIDGLGEVANAICGQLAAAPKFLEAFGVLEQAPPLFSMGGAMYPRAFGALGHLSVDGALVVFGYSIRDVMSAPTFLRRS